jgi:hypothetical protein
MKWTVIAGVIGLALLGLACVDAWAGDVGDRHYLTGFLQGVARGCGLETPELERALAAVIASYRGEGVQRRAWDAWADGLWDGG